MALKDYAGASSKYRAALAVEEKFEPKLNRLEAQVNLSKAMMLSGNSGRGKDFISKNLEDDKFPDSMKRSMFLILMGDWSPGASMREVTEYFEKYRDLMEGDTLVNRYEKQNPVYNLLASMAIEAEEPGRALFWYNQMIDPVEVGKAYSGRIKQLKDQVAKARGKPGADQFIDETQVTIAGLEAEVKKQGEQLGQILMGKGSAHYAKGGLRQGKTILSGFGEALPESSR